MCSGPQESGAQHPDWHALGAAPLVHRLRHLGTVLRRGLRALGVRNGNFFFFLVPLDFFFASTVHRAQCTVAYRALIGASNLMLCDCAVTVLWM